MPELNDFRTKNENELSFYVYDNLRGNAMRVTKKDTIYRYDSLEEAVNKFKEFPLDWTTAIGCSINGGSEIDLVHRVNGEPVKVMDFYHIDMFRENVAVHTAMSQLEHDLSIHYQLAGEIHPRRSVLTELVSSDYSESYLNGKVLFVPFERNSNSLYASINEVLVEGKGWMVLSDFLDAYPNDSYTEPHAPVVSKVNINYLETESGRTGQCDTSPVCMREMMKKTKEFQCALEKKHKTIEEQIADVLKERSDKSAKKEKYNEFERT